MCQQRPNSQSAAGPLTDLLARGARKPFGAIRTRDSCGRSAVKTTTAWVHQQSRPRGFRERVRTGFLGERWNKQTPPKSSREAAACDSPARKCRVGWEERASPDGTTPVLTHTL